MDPSQLIIHINQSACNDGLLTTFTSGYLTDSLYLRFESKNYRNVNKSEVIDNFNSEYIYIKNNTFTKRTTDVGDVTITDSDSLKTFCIANCNQLLSIVIISEKSFFDYAGEFERRILVLHSHLKSVFMKSF